MLGASFVSIFSPCFCQPILPRYASLVPFVYVRAVSILWEARHQSAKSWAKLETHLNVPVRLEDVQNRLDVLELEHTRTCKETMESVSNVVVPADSHLVLDVPSNCGSPKVMAPWRRVNQRRDMRAIESRCRP